MIKKKTLLDYRIQMEDTISQPCGAQLELCYSSSKETWWVGQYLERI